MPEKRKIEFKNTRVKGIQRTVRETIFVDGKEVWSGEYWPDSEKSCEAHGDKRSAALANLGITEEEERQAEIDAWNSR